jgi:ABC-type transport system involved in multi-copper enzyme maturation permease subunit
MTEPARPAAAPRLQEHPGTFDALVEKLRRAGVALQSPILVREMRTLLRGRKFFASHILLLVVLAGVLLIAATTAGVSGDDPSKIGRLLFWSFVFGLGVVIIFLVPAFSCTALTTERETKTLDLLLTTTIRPWEVIWGKLLSALGVILLFMVSALPLVSVCFLFGGISPWDLAQLYLVVLFCTLVVSSMSLAVSAHCKESKSAVVISYVLTMVFLGVVLAGGIFLVESSTSGRGLDAFSGWFSGLHWSEQLLFVVVPQFLGGAIFALNFAAAANRLKPATANRSTNLRAIWLAFLLGGLLLYMLTLEVLASRGRLAKGDWSAMLVATMVIAALLLWPSSLYFSSEEVRLSPRLMEDTGRLKNLLVPLRIFMPGPATGLAYSAVSLVLVFGGMVWFGGASAASCGDGQAAWRNASAALPLGLFLAASAGLAALYSSLGLRHLPAGFAAFGTSVLLAFGPMIHLGCQEAINTSTAASTLWNLHYLSPVLAGMSAWGSGSDAWSMVTLFGPDPQASGPRQTPQEGVPLWVAAVLAYLVLNAVVWSVALIRVRRVQGRWKAELSRAQRESQSSAGCSAPEDTGRSARREG